jgi:hypothetical protein
LFFRPNDLTPYQLSYFKLIPTEDSASTKRARLLSKEPNFVGKVQVDDNKWIVSNEVGKFSLVECAEEDGICSNSDFQVLYNYYKSWQEPGSQQSGAYIFRPQGETINHSIPYSPLQFQ